MTYDLTGAPAVPPLRGKGTLITGVVLVILGLLGIILGIVMTANAASSLFNSIGTPQTAPASFTRDLNGGTTYAVYEATTGGTGTTGDPFLGNVQAGDVTVTGPSGDVTVTDTGNQVNTVGDGKTLYAEVATFDPPSSGSYTIKVATEGSLVAVAPSLSSAAKGFVWILAIVAGALLGLIGLILLIVGAVQRSSSRKKQREALGQGAGYPGQGYPAQGYPTPATTPPAEVQPYAEAQPYAAPQNLPVDPQQAYAAPAAAAAAAAPPQPTAAPPAGWYPDPERPGGQRYWDGVAWTEHRA